MANERFEREAHGAVIIDGKEVASTLQCPHCGLHFISYRGSGKRRFYCWKCAAITCGLPACDHCVPTEKMLKEIERKAKCL